jgi:hypothetical protein
MTALKHGLSGYVPIRDGIRLDYCFTEAIESLLPVCDEVIAIDSESADGTRYLLDHWSKHEPKLRVVSYPWPRLPTPEEVERDDPKRPPGDPRMLIAWLNYGRARCLYDRQITLDADEILDPASHPEIRRAVEDGIPRWFNRVNLWGDPFHEAPHGTVCGERVVRIAPTSMEMCSDEPRPEGEPEIRRLAIDGPQLTIFHMGFLRPQDAFLRKSRIMQAALHNCYDPRLRESERTGRSWTDASPFPEGYPILAFDGNRLPPLAKSWCRERGYRI